MKFQSIGERLDLNNKLTSHDYYNRTGPLVKNGAHNLKEDSKYEKTSTLVHTI